MRDQSTRDNQARVRALMIDLLKKHDRLSTAELSVKLTEHPTVIGGVLRNSSSFNVTEITKGSRYVSLKPGLIQRV
jgi:hypothetical protein